MRKIVQITSAAMPGQPGPGLRPSWGEPHLYLFALCEDGTLWRYDQDRWIQLDNIQEGD